MSANSIQIKTSAGSPASFTYFHEATADYAILRNNSAVSIDYTQDAGATSAALAAGEVIILDLTGSTSDVGVRRTDKEAASVSVELGYGFDASDIDLILKRLTDSDPVAAADITDAGTAGIAVLQAETPAQGRTALGVGSALTPVTTTALSGTQVVLTEASAHAQVFTLTADTIVKLPDGGANTWAFAIFHGGGAFTLSINKADDTLLKALTAGDHATIVWDGTALGAY